MLATAPVCLALFTCLWVTGGCRTDDNLSAPPLNGHSHTHPKSTTTGVLATFPTHARTAAFDVTVNRRAAKSLKSQFEATNDHAWRFTLAGVREIHFQRINGVICVQRDVDHTERVTVDYDPPLRFLSASLQQDAPIEGTSKMTVRNLGAESIRDQGTCQYKVEWKGQKQIETKLGMLDVQHVRMTRKIKLNLAEVDITIDQLRHEKVGLVRGYTVRHTRALGLIGSTSTEDMIKTKVDPVDALTGSPKAKGD